jgi:hypothetical protein
MGASVVVTLLPARVFGRERADSATEGRDNLDRSLGVTSPRSV